MTLYFRKAQFKISWQLNYVTSNLSWSIFHADAITSSLNLRDLLLKLEEISFLEFGSIQKTYSILVAGTYSTKIPTVNIFKISFQHSNLMISKLESRLRDHSGLTDSEVKEHVLKLDMFLCFGFLNKMKMMAL